VITTQARQPAVTALHEALLAILMTAGFPPVEAISIKGAVFRYLIGHLILHDNPEGPPWKDLDERHPHMRRAGAVHETIDRHDLFLRGLDALIGGWPSP
jgi:hypothetical protein